ncbi:MAG: potassium transporter TrkA [Tenericutes bacterium HGW-Tenericutes-6]|jgi:trk system potassium uptake protein TrkA|nr:MAG: potassium transporter TrkA [Tenericutes bacterium HGW-Tenericutes-6]
MKRNKFIVIGSGRLGANIATKMSEVGEDVIIIDAKDDSFRKLQESFSGYEMVGDATDLQLLENAYIKHAKTVVITTDSDNVNIYLAHICYYVYNVPKIFVRLSDTDKGRLLEGTYIKAIYPFLLSLNEFMTLNEEEEDV